MHVMVIGATGMVGQKLLQRLAEEPDVLNADLSRLTLIDTIEAPTPSAFASITRTTAIDFSAPGAATQLAAERPDLIFHLAAIVSGEAEADFDKGYAVNLDGSRALFEAIRQEGMRDVYKPRVVFASSVAVFGAPFPDIIDDTFFTTPLTSYGAQKAMTELLLADYSRRGFIEGVGLRLPTICIRPGKPNRAASGFFSNILREPLIGCDAVLPVDENVRHWFASPRAAVGFFLHAARLSLSQLGARCNITMPGLSAVIAEEIEALRRVAGEAAVRRIRREPDANIQKIVSGWPSNFNADRALSLGFRAETSFDQIIRTHIEDELGGNLT